MNLQNKIYMYIWYAMFGSLLMYVWVGYGMYLDADTSIYFELTSVWIFGIAMAVIGILYILIQQIFDPKQKKADPDERAGIHLQKLVLCTLPAVLGLMLIPITKNVLMFVILIVISFLALYFVGPPKKRMTMQSTKDK